MFGFLLQSGFWIGVSFVLFFVIFGKKLWAPIAHVLDQRAETVRKDLQEVQQLRQEAESKLKEATRVRDQAVQEAKDIVTQSRKQAEEMAKNAREETKKTLKFYEETAKNRIAMVESLAMKDIKHRAVDLAFKAAEGVIPSVMDKDKQETSIEKALAQMPKKGSKSKVA